MGLREFKYLKGTNTFTELDAGAYYYAFSINKATDTYSEATANVTLPDRIQYQGTGEKRNAYISLGISGPTGNGDGIDLGISNTGNGWFPCYNDVPTGKFVTYDGTMAGFDNYTVGTKATHAIIKVSVVNSTNVKMIVQFTDNNNNQVGKKFDETISVKGERNWKRFYRFASLVGRPSYTNAQDSTFMLGGAFNDLGLKNKRDGYYYHWGINATSPELVSDAWILNFPRGQVKDITEWGETFAIDNWR